MSVNETRKRDYKKRSKQTRKKNEVTIKTYVGGLIKFPELSSDTIQVTENDKNEKLTKYIKNKNDEKMVEEVTNVYNEYFKRIIKKLIDTQSQSQSPNKESNNLSSEEEKSVDFINKLLDKKDYFKIGCTILNFINSPIFTFSKKNNTYVNHLTETDRFVFETKDIDITNKNKNDMYDKIFDCANWYFYLYLYYLKLDDDVKQNDVNIDDDNNRRLIKCIYYLSSFTLKDNQMIDIKKILNISNQNDTKSIIAELNKIKEIMNVKEEKYYFYDLLINRLIDYLNNYNLFISESIDNLLNNKDLYNIDKRNNIKSLLNNKYEILKIKHEILTHEKSVNGVKKTNIDKEISELEKEITDILDILNNYFVTEKFTEEDNAKILELLKDDVQEEKDDVQKEKDDVQEEKDDVQEEKDDVQEEKNDVQKEKDDVQEEKDDVQEEKDDVQEEKNDVQKEKDDVQKEKDDVQEEKDDVQKENDDKQDDVDSKEDKDVQKDVVDEKDEIVKQDNAQEEQNVKQEENVDGKKQSNKLKNLFKMNKTMKDFENKIQKLNNIVKEKIDEIKLSVEEENKKEEEDQITNKVTKNIELLNKFNDRISVINNELNNDKSIKDPEKIKELKNKLYEIKKIILNDKNNKIYDKIQIKKDIPGKLYQNDNLIKDINFNINTTNWNVYYDLNELKIKKIYKKYNDLVIETDSNKILTKYNKDNEDIYDKFYIVRWNAGFIDEIKDRKRAIKYINDGKTYSEYIYDEGQNSGDVEKIENKLVLKQRFGPTSGYYKIWDEEFKVLNTANRNEFTEEESKSIEDAINNQQKTDMEKSLNNETIPIIEFISFLSEEQKKDIRDGKELPEEKQILYINNLQNNNLQKDKKIENKKPLTRMFDLNEKNEIFNELQLNNEKIKKEQEYLIKKNKVQYDELFYEIMNYDIKNLIKVSNETREKYIKAKEEDDKRKNRKKQTDAEYEKEQKERTERIEKEIRELEEKERKEKEEEDKKNSEGQEKEDAEYLKNGKPMMFSIHDNEDEDNETGESFLNNIVFTPYGFELVIDFTKFNIV